MVLLHYMASSMRLFKFFDFIFYTFFKILKYLNYADSPLFQCIIVAEIYIATKEKSERFVYF